MKMGLVVKKIFWLAAVAAVGCATLEAGRRSVSESIGTGRVVAIHGWDGRYAGPVAPAAPGCGAASTGLLTIGRGEFAFDPFQGIAVIRGKVSDDDRLEGALSRTGGSKQLASIAFSAAARESAGEDVVEGTMISGRCRWTVALKRA